MFPRRGVSPGGECVAEQLTDERVPARETFLVVEPSRDARRRLESAMRAEGREVRVASTANEGLGLLHVLQPSVIAVSLELPELPGPRAIEVFAQRARGALVVAVGGEPSVEDAVQAVRRGAVDYVSAHDDLDTVTERVEQVTVARRRREEASRPGQGAQEHVRRILCQNADMLEVLELIRKVAQTDAVALLTGETGTGKELVGRAIHEKSARCSGPFFSVNCSAFGEAALETELFGHGADVVPGAGARDGQIAMASGGTLFVNEIEAMPPSLQVKLLQLLDRGVYQRVGEREPRAASVRIVVASDADLEQAAARGSFRQDLYYRITVFPIHLPALRDRPEDIPLLMRAFLEEVARENDVVAPVVTAAAMQAILRFPWPGNVRQLRSLCERWVIGNHGGRVDIEHVPVVHAPLVDCGPPEIGDTPVDVERTLRENVAPVVERVERAYFESMLRRCEGHLGNTAEQAGITRRTLYTKMRAYGLDQRDYRGG